MAAIPAGIGLGELAGIFGGAGQLAGGLGGLFGGQQGGGFDQAAFGEEQNLSWAQLNAQEAFQREMAQNSIQWRVQDARAAGVSPLAALGASTAGGVVSAPGVSPVELPSADSLGERIGHAGQNIGNAISKTLTASEKGDLAFKTQQQQQQLQSTDLDIQIKGAQLARLNQALQTPGAGNVNPATGPLAGQGVVHVVPDKVVSSAIDDPSRSAGEHTGTGFNKTYGGGTYAVPTDQAVINNPGITNPFMYQWMWNRWGPMLRDKVEEWSNPIRSGFSSAPPSPYVP